MVEWRGVGSAHKVARNRTSPVSAILKAIDGAGAPLSVVAIAKRAELNADLVTAALKDAMFAGFITQVTGLRAA